MDVFELPDPEPQDYTVTIVVVIVLLVLIIIVAGNIIIIIIMSCHVDIIVFMTVSLTLHAKNNSKWCFSSGGNEGADATVSLKILTSKLTLMLFLIAGSEGTSAGATPSIRKTFIVKHIYLLSVNLFI